MAGLFRSPARCPAPSSPSTRRSLESITQACGGARRARGMTYPVTPDGRYFAVRGRLWRRTDPALPEAERARLTRELMAARRAVRAALAQDDPRALGEARAAVDRAKVALGERGPIWWSDGAPDYGRRLARNTPYAAWHAEVAAAQAEAADVPPAARGRRGASNARSTSPEAPPRG